MVVRVRVRVVAIDAVEGLRVRAGVQLVGVEVVEGRAVELVRAALGRDDDAGQAAELGAVGVGEHLHFRDGVQARGGVRQFAEDAGRRGLAILHVRRAIGASAEELDGIEAADDVGVEREEVLDVAAVARQVAQLLGVEPAGDGLALERDVLTLGDHRDDVLEVADFELQVGTGHRRRTQDDAGATARLEAGQAGVDRVRAGPQVRHLEQALRVADRFARDPGVFVGDDHGRAWHDAALGIVDRAADGAERGLRRGRRRGQHRDGDDGMQEDGEAVPPCTQVEQRGRVPSRHQRSPLAKPWTWTSLGLPSRCGRACVNLCGCCAAS